MTDTKAAGPVTAMNIRWREGRLFESGPEGRMHLVDADSKLAPGPVEALLGSVLSCSAVDILDILAKRRTPVTALSASVSAQRRADPPRRIMRMELEFRIDGPGIEAEHAERAIELSFEKYCSVGASLAPDIETTSRLVLNGEPQEPRPRKMFRP